MPSRSLSSAGIKRDRILIKIASTWEGIRAMETLQKAHYSQTPLADINESFKAQKMFTSRDWKRLYSDGTVTNWLQQTTDFFMANAGVKDFTPASKYFDPSLYLKTIA